MNWRKNRETNAEPYYHTEAEVEQIIEKLIEDIKLDTECRGCNLIYGCECEPLTIEELNQQLKDKWL